MADTATRKSARDAMTPFHALARQILDPQDPALLALATMRPRRVLVDILRCSALIAGAWSVLALGDPSWALGAACFLLIGTQQYALVIMAHDGRHGRLLPRRAANDRLTRFVLSAPMLHDADYAAEAALHLAHHRGLGTAADPERHLYAAAGKATRTDFLLYLTALPTVPAVLRKILRRSPAAVQPRSRASLLSMWMPVLLMQLLIAVVISQLTAWWYYVVFWLGPIYVCVFVPKKIRVLCEHGQPILPDDAADARRLKTFVPNAIERWLLAPMNMQYHAEHHLWPQVPYYNLPALHRLVGPHPAIELCHSYVGYLRAYFRRLPLEPAAVPALVQ